ncbi:YbaB/EbfC DNA-binding family protein [Krasilnikovia cinnamomea]|uniref:YbaB/EbfC DNA-binding family protein n=1 Tax=Krasilnikovia cinnamomea TaxID=349313 RepID=A0A4Q7ZEE1_9ACTN|nr:YbaB/EbfC family nucleoid-associated protein [Krasilnikovia cinnamomea]RZU48483.1 YbaB/EbfC DNA-binding family protein [Krasilnikovia cinnamomea]
MTMPDDWIRTFELRAQEQAARAHELSRQLQERSVTVASADGEVRLTVDSAGGLAGLEFGRGASELSLEDLAALVLQTSRRAQARLAESMSEAVAQVFGQGSETASFVSQAYAERFPRPDDDADGDQR